MASSTLGHWVPVPPRGAGALATPDLILSPTAVSPSRLGKMCMDLLQMALCSPTSPEQLQVLCAAILREMSPLDDLALSCDHTQNTRLLSLVASVLLAQVPQLPALGAQGCHPSPVVLVSPDTAG